MYFTTEDIMRLQNSYVSCVCDIVPERVEEALQKLGPSVTGYTDVDAFLKHPDLDAVFVVTSDKSHAFLAKKVLAAKKHLFLEKPMAQSIQDCDDIIDAWEGSGVVFFVGLELRYCTLFRDMKEIISRGDQGIHAQRLLRLLQGLRCFRQLSCDRGLRKRHPTFLHGMPFHTGIHP